MADSKSISNSTNAEPIANTKARMRIQLMNQALDSKVSIQNKQFEVEKLQRIYQSNEEFAVLSSEITAAQKSRKGSPVDVRPASRTGAKSPSAISQLSKKSIQPSGSAALDNKTAGGPSQSKIVSLKLEMKKVNV